MLIVIAVMHMCRGMQQMPCNFKQEVTVHC